MRRLRCLNDPKATCLKSSTCAGELGVIEDVLSLRSELGIQMFGDMRSFHQAHIPVVDAGVFETVAPCVPFDMQRILARHGRGCRTFASRVGECIDVEVVLVAPMCRNRIPNSICHRGAESSAIYPVGWQDRRTVLTGRKRGDAIPLPAAKHFIDYSGRVGQKSLSVAERQFIDIAENGTVADVVIAIALVVAFHVKGRHGEVVRGS